jgi:uncharacterized membrane protein/PKD repeat protein
MSVHRPFARILSAFLSILLFLQSAAPAFRPRPVAASPLPQVVTAPFRTPQQTGPTAAPTNNPTLPAALANPLSVSRFQSSYQAGGSLVITFTVTNNRPPAALPTIPPTATVTETAELLSTYDPGRDPNTIHHALLVNTLTNNATLLSASPRPNQDGSTYSWNLGDLPPQSSHSITITVQGPPSAVDFIDLDNGATVYGMLQGRAVTSQAGPARLAPDDMAQWLIWTVDAATDDEAMLRQSAELGQDPIPLFEHVRSLGYELYNGSLRGTRGTLWSAAGNSLDQSSLLIAMLRAAGVPARYRHGELAAADAQTLIAAMFPTPTQYSGHVPPGSATSDPVNDPALIAEAQDHWWVEAYLPGLGWTNLDPSFAAANVGDLFAATIANDGTDRIAELPDDLRHKIDLELTVEQFSAFPQGAGALQLSTPLSLTINTVELVGRPLTLDFWVDTEVQGGLVFANFIHTYTPHFILGNHQFYYPGTAFQDVLTNFPLGSYFTTGIWLTIERQNPNGAVEQYQRQIKDLIGVAARQGTGVITLPPRGTDPLLQPGDMSQLQVVPQSYVPPAELDRLQAALLTVAPAVSNAYLESDTLEENNIPANSAFFQEHLENLDTGQMLMLDWLGTAYNVNATDPGRQPDSAGFLVKSYPAEPKLLLISQSALTATLTNTLASGVATTFELLNLRERAIAYPGQAVDAAIAATTMRTMGDKAIEFALMESVFGETPDSAFATFQAAVDQELPLGFASPDNLGDLADAPISDEAKARITTATQEGKVVVFPYQDVILESGPAMGWLEIDPEGNASYVSEEGLRASGNEYGLVTSRTAIAAAEESAFYGGMMFTILRFIAGVIQAISVVPLFNPKALLGQMALAAAFAIKAGIAQCAGKPPTCYGGVASAAAIIGNVLILGSLPLLADPPLPPLWFDMANRPPAATPTAGRVFTFTATHASTQLNLAATIASLSTYGSVSDSWSSPAGHGFAYDTLSAPAVDLYDADNTFLGSGALQSQPAESAAAQGNSLSATLDGVGGQSFYAPAASGLSAASQWQDYTATLTSAAPYTLNLDNTTVTLDATDTYTGSFEAIVTGPSTLTGNGRSPLPASNNATTLTAQSARFNLGPAAGTIQVGGQPLDAANGLALAGYTGPATLAQQNASLDLLTLSGNATFFTLHLSDDASTIPPTGSATFAPNILANTTGSYTITVAAPAGWNITLDNSGEITAVPPSGAAPADYTLLVVAQSVAHPDLFVSALHTVTITAHQGMALTVLPDPQITIPMGEILDPDATLGGLNGHVENGQAEIPGAAYTIILTNTSNLSHTFDITVDGLPAGWTILSHSQANPEATTMSLPAGGSGRLGLYISPTLTSLLPPGTNYAIDVTATAQDNGSLSEQATVPFTMPALAFPYPVASPALLYAEANSAGTVELTLTNVGNVGGSFPVTVTMYSSPFHNTPLSPTLLTSPAAFNTPVLAPGASSSHQLTFTTDGTIPGEDYFLVASSASGFYLPSAYFAVQIVGPYSGPIYQTSAEVGETCSLNSPTFAPSLQALAQAVAALEQSCSAATCSLDDRDAVVEAALLVAEEATFLSPLLTAAAEIESIANNMAGHTTDPTLEADMAALSAAVTDLGDQACAVAQHLPSLRLTPVFNAALPGQPLTYTLELTNQGTETTTYEVTTTLPTGVDTFDVTLVPSATDTTTLVVSSAVLGLYPLSAEATATGPDVPAGISDTTTAYLNVVDRFVQVTAVTANPAFVETGVSSTTLSVDVTNVANVLQSTTARTTLLAPDGSTSWTADIPLTVLIGDPHRYDLATVNTSGWDAGVYTITVELLAEGTWLETLIPDGSGFGYLGVGQALGASHAVYPTVVAPGTVTVTTILTTEILADTIQPPTTQPLAPWPQLPLLTGEPTSQQPTLPTNDPLQPPTESALGLPTHSPTPNPQSPLPNPQPPLSNTQYAISNTDQSPISNLQSPSSTWAITRTENTAPAVTYTGSWSLVNNLNAWRASHSDFHHSYNTGDTATFNFSGTWLAVGFATTTDSGYAELFLDGVSQGLVDLYNRSDDVKRVTLTGLSNAAHVVTVTVTGQKNPFSSNDRVAVDYFDTWDGTAMPDGTYEQNSGRVWLSAGWVNQNDAVASGGSYYRSGYTAWFPFTGDSLTFQPIAYPSAEKIALYLDDTFWGYYNLNAFTSQTRPIHFDGLGAGPHMLTIRTFRGAATLDTFTTPATGPATPPPAVGSFHRYEENNPAILYNGVPFTQTKTTWFSDFNDTVSDHYTYDSGNPGDTAVLTFTGTSVGVGFFAAWYSGYVELFLDGVSQGVYDTYRRDTTTISVYFHNLTNTTHTLTITVLGQKNPLANNDEVYLDYIDVWDGTPLPTGTFEELDGRLYRSYRWSLENNPQASGGQYLQDAIASAANVWFPFTGDSVTFRAIANNQGGQWTQLTIDGQPLAELNLYSGEIVSRTFSFDGLGSGLHVLQLERYRGELTIDTFTTPGVAPFYQTPVYTGVVRYEEDDPALLYNGFSYAQRPPSWTEEYLWEASGSYASLATTAGNTVSLTFDGRWASVGFFTNQYGGQAELFVDGVSQGIAGLYSLNSGVESFTISGLLTGTHTLSITVLGLPDPPSTQNRVHVDYIDVWDGQTMPDETVNASKAEQNGRIHASALVHDTAHANAIDGDYLLNTAGNPRANVWYSFTGDNFTFYGFSNNFGTPKVDLYVDDQFVATVSLLYPFSLQPISHHFDGFGDGAHIVRISNNSGIRVDAFASGSESAYFRPLAEWWESDRTGGASWWGGVHSSLAVGDVNDDGLVEIALTASALGPNGELFLIRGDGQDTGDGDPILWDVAYNIFNGFEHVGGTAIADLDGQPGAEIVTANTLGMYAYHSDGSTYWYTNTLTSNRFFGTPSIGNLDLDDEPEVVINLNDTLAVFEHDGTLAWSFNDSDGVTIPLLADLTGDGRLDILFHSWEDTLYLYDYNLGSPQLVWTKVFTNAMHGYGAPAVADLDDDGTSEVAVATENWLFALNSEDGSIQWSAALDPGRVGGVTIADIDGDGAIELVVGVNFNGGTLYAFEANGTFKWSAAALDSSPLNTSAADLDSDGAAELLWNGNPQGFTIYDGRTGTILFNEPQAYSATGTDIPVAADVDLDGYLEVVVPAHGGIRVFGFDGVWGPARPLWNQLNYHITNINDDLTVPYSEFNSWQTHNTYRAQWPDNAALPVYDVTLNHTVALTDVTVLTDTFSTPPTTADDPLYGWDYTQTWAETTISYTFQSRLTNLQPGEARLVAQGTAVSYTLPSGQNYLELPPLYVSVPHIIAVTPAAQTAAPGTTTVYTLTLTNPAATPDTYTLAVGGLPAAWLAYPNTVNLSAGETDTVLLHVTIPANTTPAETPFLVAVTNNSGGEDQAGASLVVAEGVEMAITPTTQTAETGAPTDYTLTITNPENTAHTYALSATGLALVTLPPSINVPAQSSESISITAVTPGSGPHPFTIHATGDNGSAGSAGAVLEGLGDRTVALTLAPATAVAGRGTLAVYTATVTNLGTMDDLYTFNLPLPAGWSYQFSANGLPVTELALPPALFNSADLLLTVTPALTATLGVHPLNLTVQSQTNPGVTAQASATINVLNRGVQVNITPSSTILDPTDTGVWQIQLTNTGTIADSYNLSVLGMIALSADFSTNPVALAPGASTTVQLTANDLDFALPQTYPFLVTATSQANPAIHNHDTAEVTFTAYEAVEVAWQPASQTVTNALTADFVLVVTNTGNLPLTYTFSVEGDGLGFQLGLAQMLIPAHLSVAIPVFVQANGGGVYTLEGTAASTTGNTTASATANLTILADNLPPSANAGPNQSGDEGDPFLFNGTATDPEGQPLAILWHFGDGTTAANTLTPNHTYADDGLYTVTLVVTDTAGHSHSDILLVTVANVAPTVAAGPDQTGEAGQPLTFNGSFTDPGLLDTHTIHWDFGDGGTADNTLTPLHIYQTPGLYTVTLTITDDDGGTTSDTLLVTINGAFGLIKYLPIIVTNP